MTIEELLEKPYWIIDILPKRVPKDSPGQYFAVEDFFLKKQLLEIKKKHINVILKLNCYMDITIDDEKNPAPERIWDIMLDRYVYIMLGDAMILSEPDDTHLTIFYPDEGLLDLIKAISSSEGLFVWKGLEDECQAKGVLPIMNVSKRIIRVMDIAVFAFTTIAIAGVFYEGMTLKWYDIVGIFVICMDYSFMLTTILHLIADRKEKWYPIHIISMVLIIVAIVMKTVGIAYPAITLLLWYFYLWFLYGSILVGRYVVKRTSAK